MEVIQLTEMLAKCQEENAALRLRAEQAEARVKMADAVVSDKNAHIARLEHFIAEHLSRLASQDVIVDALRKNTTAEELLEKENAVMRARCKRLKEALRQGISLHENGDAMTCMCGESVLRHNYQADHPITPMLEYYGAQWVDIARKALEDK